MDYKHVGTDHIRAKLIERQQALEVQHRAVEEEVELLELVEPKNDQERTQIADQVKARRQAMTALEQTWDNVQKLLDRYPEEEPDNLAKARANLEERVAPPNANGSRRPKQRA